MLSGLHQHDDLKRFDLKWMPVPFSGCWIWLGNSQHFGYGFFKVNGRRQMAHRVAWELYRGPIPEGLQVNHHCDVAPCVNPNHLYIGTQAQNLADCKSRGRARYWTPSHCPQGHEYTPENSMRPGRGGLRCRICVNARRKKWRRKHALRVTPTFL